MDVFFDLEFTGLHQHTSLISIGCVAEDGRMFYAESTEYNTTQINPWLKENVIANLQLGELEPGHDDLPRMSTSDKLWTILGKEWQIRKWFKEWINFPGYGQVEMWGDVYAYDWMLFCELFDGPDPAERLPKNIYYIPFDIATLMKIKGVDPDISREIFSGLPGLRRHNSLDDARLIQACHAKLILVSDVLGRNAAKALT